MTLTLTTDIVSYTRKTYAKKGDKVKLISSLGEVLIVEKDGERFPVREEKTKREK